MAEPVGMCAFGYTGGSRFVHEKVTPPDCPARTPPDRCDKCSFWLTPAEIWGGRVGDMVTLAASEADPALPESQPNGGEHAEGGRAGK